MTTVTFLADNIHGLSMDEQGFIFWRGDNFPLEELSEPYNTEQGSYRQVKVLTPAGLVRTVVENGEIELC